MSRGAIRPSLRSSAPCPTTPPAPRWATAVSNRSMGPGHVAGLRGRSRVAGRERRRCGRDAATNELGHVVVVLGSGVVGPHAECARGVAQGEGMVGLPLESNAGLQPAPVLGFPFLGRIWGSRSRMKRESNLAMLCGGGSSLPRSLQICPRQCLLRSPTPVVNPEPNISTSPIRSKRTALIISCSITDL